MKRLNWSLTRQLAERGGGIDGGRARESKEVKLAMRSKMMEGQVCVRDET